MAVPLSVWLSTCAKIPADRLPELLQLLSEEWITDLPTLKQCHDGLRNKVPVAAWTAIQEAFEQLPTEPPPQPPPPLANGTESFRSHELRSISSQRRGFRKPSLNAAALAAAAVAPPARRAAGSHSQPVKLVEQSMRSSALDDVTEVSAEQEAAFSPEPMAKPPALRLEERSLKSSTGETSKTAASPQSQPNPEFVRQVDAYRRTLRRMYRWTLMPDSRFMQRWDLVLLSVLLFVATITPFEVGFLPAPEYNAIFVVNRFVDAVFGADILLNFFVAYREGSEQGGRWVFDNRKIALHYVRGWFLLDVISALPTDSLLLAIASPSAADVDSSVVQPSVLSRLLRLLRLIKLLRLIRISRILARWQANIGLSHAMTTLLEFLLLVLFASHWLACLWGFVGRNSGDGVLSVQAERDPLNESWIERAGLVELFDERSPDGPILGALRLYGATLYVSLNNIFVRCSRSHTCVPLLPTISTADDDAMLVYSCDERAPAGWLM